MLKSILLQLMSLEKQIFGQRSDKEKIRKKNR